jgi:hypothetical protein
MTGTNVPSHLVGASDNVDKGKMGAGTGYHYFTVMPAELRVAVEDVNDKSQRDKVTEVPTTTRELSNRPTDVTASTSK